jgi:hypothetical protein
MSLQSSGDYFHDWNGTKSITSDTGRNATAGTQATGAGKRHAAIACIQGALDLELRGAWQRQRGGGKAGDKPPDSGSVAQAIP